MSGIADRKESCDIAKKDGNPVRFLSFLGVFYRCAVLAKNNPQYANAILRVVIHSWYLASSIRPRFLQIGYPSSGIRELHDHWTHSFLYLYNTMKRFGLPDGIIDKIILQFLFNREKSPLPGKFLLTHNLHCATIVVLGRLGDRPFLLYNTDPEVVSCAEDSIFPRTAKLPYSVK